MKNTSLLVIPVLLVFIFVYTSNIGGEKIDTSSLEYRIEEGSVIKLSKNDNLFLDTYKVVVELNQENIVLKVTENEYLKVKENDIVYFTFIGNHSYKTYFEKEQATNFIEKKPSIDLRKPNWLRKLFIA